MTSASTSASTPAPTVAPSSTPAPTSSACHTLTPLPCSKLTLLLGLGVGVRPLVSAVTSATRFPGLSCLGASGSRRCCKQIIFKLRLLDGIVAGPQLQGFSFCHYPLLLF